MSDYIPITFEYEGKEIKGFLSPVFGAGTKNWHLMIDKYYCGALFYSEPFGWQYHGNSYNELADFFADYVVAWYQ